MANLSVFHKQIKNNDREAPNPFSILVNSFREHPRYTRFPNLCTKLIKNQKLKNFYNLDFGYQAIYMEKIWQCDSGFPFDFQDFIRKMLT